MQDTRYDITAYHSALPLVTVVRYLLCHARTHYPLATPSDKAIFYGKSGGVCSGLSSLPWHGDKPSSGSDRANHGRSLCKPGGVFRGGRGRGAGQHQGVWSVGIKASLGAFHGGGDYVENKCTPRSDHADQTDD